MMKPLPLFLAAALALTACSKSDDPAAQANGVTAAPLHGTWTFQSETRLTTPKNGGPATSTVRPIPAGSYTVSFAANGQLTSQAGTGAPTTGTYTNSGTTISIPTTGPNGTKVQVLTAAELTATRLVTVEQTEDTPNRYTTTVVFSR